MKPSTYIAVLEGRPADKIPGESLDRWVEARRGQYDGFLMRYKGWQAFVSDKREYRPGDLKRAWDWDVWHMNIFCYGEEVPTKEEAMERARSYIAAELGISEARPSDKIPPYVPSLKNPRWAWDEVVDGWVFDYQEYCAYVHLDEEFEWCVDGGRCGQGLESTAEEAKRAAISAIESAIEWGKFWGGFSHVTDIVPKDHGPVESAPSDKIPGWDATLDHRWIQVSDAPDFKEWELRDRDVVLVVFAPYEDSGYGRGFRYQGYWKAYHYVGGRRSGVIALNSSKSSNIDSVKQCALSWLRRHRAELA